MKLKYYVALVIAVIAIMSVALWKFGIKTDFSITLYNGRVIQLPIVLWLGTVLVLLVLLSFVFFIVDFLREKFINFRISHDIDTLCTQMLNQSVRHDFSANEKLVFKIPHIAMISRAVARFSLNPKIPSEPCGLSRIDGIFESIKQINLGYEQNVKKFNFSDGDAFFVKNIFNSIRRDHKIGFNVISEARYDDTTRREAFLLMAQKATAKELYLMLQKSLALDPKTFTAACEGIMAEHAKTGAKIDETAIFKAMKRANLEENDFVNLAKITKTSLDPDEWLKIFENIAISNERAELAFLYVLCDLEMLSLAQNRLATLPKNEYAKIRAYVDLRKHGANYPLDLFFSA